MTEQVFDDILSIKIEGIEFSDDYPRTEIGIAEEIRARFQCLTSFIKRTKAKPVTPPSKQIIKRSSPIVLLNQSESYGWLRSIMYKIYNQQMIDKNFHEEILLLWRCCLSATNDKIFKETFQVNASDLSQVWTAEFQAASIPLFLSIVKRLSNNIIQEKFGSFRYAGKCTSLEFVSDQMIVAMYMMIANGYEIQVAPEPEKKKMILLPGFVSAYENQKCILVHE